MVDMKFGQLGVATIAPVISPFLYFSSLDIAVFGLPKSVLSLGSRFYCRKHSTNSL
jgi:hypothetical protein